MPRRRPSQASLVPADPLGERELKHLFAYLCLVPVFGFFPALWVLYRRRGTAEQRAASRTAVSLALIWVLGYALLGAGAEASEGLRLPLALTSSLLSSGYFLTSLWLMYRLWRRQSLKLPGVEEVADRLP